MMSRALIVLQTDDDREKACRWARGVPLGSRIEFKETKRSLPQNDRLWAMLTDVAIHMKKQGRDHTPDQWKVIFMAAYGHEVKFLPTLDQKSFIPLGHSSSDLSVREMTDLIEFMLAWGAEAGVVFRDPKDQSSDAPPSASDEAGDQQAAAAPAEEAGTVPDPASSTNTDVSSPAETSGNAGDPVSSSSAGSPAPETERDILIRFARDVLPLAADTTVSPSAAKLVEKEWAAQIKAMSADGVAKARAISESMRAISNNPSKLGSALEHYAHVLETTVEELGG